MRAAFCACSMVLTDTYLAGVKWQPRAEMEANTAALLPALLLGRIDGKSPIEYVTEAREKDQVRAFARRFIATRTDRLDDIREAWGQEIERMSASDIVSVHGRRVWDSRGQADRRSGSDACRRRARPRHRAGRRLDRQRRGGRSARRRQPLWRRRRDEGGRQCQRRDRQGARRPRCARPGRHRRGVDRARRHAQQRRGSAPTPRSPPRWRCCTPRPPPPGSRSMRTCLATSRR